MSFLENIFALLPDNISKKIKPIHLRTSFEYVYADMEKVKPDEVLTLGAVTATTTSINLALHSSGANSFRVGGNVLSKATANLWEFPEVTEEKVFTIYVIDDSEIIHLALDGEELPEGALFVRSITISESGISIGETDDFYMASSAWRTFTIVNEDPFIIPMGNNIAASFQIKSTVENPSIGLISQKAGKNFFPGSGFWIFNDSDFPLNLVEEEYVNGLFKFLTFEPYTVGPRKWVFIKEFFGVLVVAKITEDVDLSPYATIAEMTAETNARIAADDAEIVNRAAQDAILNAKINTEITDRTSADDYLLTQIADLNIHQITITATTSISTNTLGAIASGGTANLLQHGRNVKISNGVNAINLSCETSSAAAFVASYAKLGSAAITFTAGTGATLVQVDGTAVLNGVVGSTACLTRSGNTFYLQISNR